MAAIMAGVPIQSVMIGWYSWWLGCSPMERPCCWARGSTRPVPAWSRALVRVIATVVLGGSRLAGGRGGMLGTVAAAILFATLANVLNLNHADAFWQRVVEGLVLLLALSIEGIRQRIEERISRTQ